MDDIHVDYEQRMKGYEAIRPRSLALPVHRPQVLDALDLHGREAGIAGVGAVIHKIVNGIEAGTRRAARVLPRVRGAAVGALRFLRRVGDEVAVAGARVALERVQQAEPVARLVHSRLTLVVPVDATAGHRLRDNVTAVSDIRARVRFGAHVRG